MDHFLKCLVVQMRTKWPQMRDHAAGVTFHLRMGSKRSAIEMFPHIKKTKITTLFVICPKNFFRLKCMFNWENGILCQGGKPCSSRPPGIGGYTWRCSQFKTRLIWIRAHRHAIDNLVKNKRRKICWVCEKFCFLRINIGNCSSNCLFWFRHSFSVLTEI